jgi:hypothetical protein
MSRRALVAVTLLLAVALVALPAAAAAATYDPLNIMSDETLRAANSMSRADIQAFLDAQAGVLKTYSAAEGGPNGAHSKVVKPASQIIFEACQYWNVNPKLVLATLEKEQSLISGPQHTASASHTYGTAYHLEHAMGAGVYAGSPDSHPGFGDQVWTGTQKLGQTTGAYAWWPGKQTDVIRLSDGVRIWITPANQPTWNFYTYTPYYPQVSVWNIYVKFFGDPQAPPRLRPMYRFYNKTTGAYTFTASETERWRIVARKQAHIKFQGAAFTIDASSTANVVPLYRLYNKIGQRYVYTSSEREKNSLLGLRRGRARIYRVDAIAAYVSTDPASGPPVWRLYCKKTNSHIMTSSAAEVAALLRSKMWKSNGVVFYLGQYTPPSG